MTKVTSLAYVQPPAEAETSTATGASVRSGVKGLGFEVFMKTLTPQHLATKPLLPAKLNPEATCREPEEDCGRRKTIPE